jgi:hypothetical protein
MDATDPRGAIVWALHALYACAFPVMIAQFPVYFLYYKAARGTRLRYLMGTFIPVIIIVGLLGWTGRLVADVLEYPQLPWYAYPIDVALLASWVLAWYGWKKERDDDFWNGLGGRIKKRLTVRVRRLVTVTR